MRLCVVCDVLCYVAWFVFGGCVCLCVPRFVYACAVLVIDCVVLSGVCLLRNSVCVCV